MSYSPSEHMSPTLSRTPAQQELTTRSTPTSVQTIAQPPQPSPLSQQRPTPAPSRVQSSQPSPPNQQPYPVYPIPVLREKFDRAVHLLNTLRLAEGLAQREPKPRLDIPPPHGGHPPSVSSHASSGSHTPSTRNGGTVVSFDDNGSPSSAVANASSEPISFDGRRVRQRTRRRLSPVARARAALIRHLGSCWVCRSRRVPCPLDHHDIAVLEAELARKARQLQPRLQPGRDRSVTAPERQRPTIVNTNNPGRRQSDRLPNTSVNGQDISLIGIGHGQNDDFPSFNIPPTDNTLPIHGDEIFLDPLIGIQARSQYTSYQNGQMLLLGVFQEFFYICQHVGGSCQQICSSPEELEFHFETAHFSYNRINPSHRCRCPACHIMKDSPNGHCTCGYDGPMQVGIYGSFIRIPAYERYAPDGPDFYTAHGNPFNPPLFISNLNPGMGRSLDNNGGFDMNFDGMNQGGFFQNNNAHHAPGGHGPGPGSGPQNNFGFDTQQPGGFQFRGSQFGDTSDIDDSISIDIPNPKIPPTYRFRKPILIVAAVLSATSFIIQTHGWFMAKGRVVSLQPCLPFIGFMSLIASFVISQKFLALKYPGRQLGGNLRRVSQLIAFPLESHLASTQSILQSPFDKLSSSSAIPFRYRPAAPTIHIRGGIYL